MGDNNSLAAITSPNNAKEDSKANLNRFQFLFDNPLLLQDLLSREKLIPPDQLEIDWTLHPDRPVAQTVSLIRLQRSYLAARFHVRITNDSRILATPANLAFPFNSFNSVDLNDFKDSDAIPQILDEFLTLSEDRFMLFLHHSESSWEMIACLSPMPFIKAEVIDLSSDEEGAVSTPSSTTMQHPVCTNPDLQYVLNLLDPIVPSGAHHIDSQSNLLAAASPLDVPLFIDYLMRDVPGKSKPFQCSICNKKSASKSGLMEHMKIHDPIKALKCPDSACSYMTCRINRMDRHVETQHPTLLEGVIYHCPTCPKTFRLAPCYESHIKICTGIGMLCPFCDYVSNRLCDITRHVRLKHHSLSLLKESN